MNNNIVSIYIPTKNRKHLLKNAINSVLNQTYKEIEIIVINDGSTDDTELYLEGLRDKYNNIRVINLKASIGSCAARNIAISKANGYFITGLDDDDYIDVNYIEMLVAYWKIITKVNPEMAFIYTQHYIHTEDCVKKSRKNSSIEASDLFDSNEIGNQIFSQTKFFLKAGLFDENMPAWQDLEFFYRFCITNGGGVLLDAPVYHFNNKNRNDRISKKGKFIILSACLRMYEKHGNNEKRNLQKLLLQAYGDHYGFKISITDTLRFLKLGMWPKGYYSLFKLIFKRQFLL